MAGLFSAELIFTLPMWKISGPYERFCQTLGWFKSVGLPFKTAAKTLQRDAVVEHEQCNFIEVDVRLLCRFDIVGLSPDSAEDETGIKRAAENSEFIFLSFCTNSSGGMMANH